MNFIEMMDDLIKANNNNRLVIFVGAGVSLNSGMPSWWNLIKSMAEELKYNKCGTCNDKKTNTCSNNCNRKYDFSVNEFLEIAQYYHDENIVDYKKLLKNSLNDTEYQSNPIDDLILKIQPTHIITTNYDRLLEKSHAVNRLFFTVVKNDKDLLSYKEKNRYIIKMHGDYTEIDNDGIVLTTNDYLEYEHNHKIISTYIKALLSTHTFLFVGYGLNDYNLNLIMSWVNYIAKENNISNEDRTKHYIINVDPINVHREDYLKKSNIFVVKADDTTLENNIDSSVNIPKSLTNHKGKLLYKCLYPLHDSSVLHRKSLKMKIYNSFKCFSNWKRTTFYDLKHQYDFSKIAYLSSETLVFLYENDFNSFKNTILECDEVSKYIAEVFIKAGIKHLACRANEKNYSIPNESQEDNSIESILFQLYLNNSYHQMENILDSTDCESNAKLYYYTVLGITKNMRNSLYLMENNIHSVKDAIFYKYSSILISEPYILNTDSWDELENTISLLPVPEQHCYEHFKKLISSNVSNSISKMNTLLEKYENFYLKDNTSYYYNNLDDFHKIQAEAYQYYYYFKMNYFPLDACSNPKDFLKPYIKALVISISNVRFKKKYCDNMFINQHYEDYIFNEIDLDIMVKYCYFKNLEDIFNQYSVREITLDYENLKIIEKFRNLSNSLPIYFPNKPDKWFNLMYIINQSILKEVEKNKITLILSVVIRDWITNNNECSKEINTFFRLLNFYVNTHLKSHSKDFIQSLLNMKKFENVLKNHNYEMIICSLANKNFNNNENIDLVMDKLSTLPNTDKLCFIYVYRHFLGKEVFNSCMEKFNLKENLTGWLEHHDDECFTLFHEGFINFNINILGYYKQKLEKNIAYKETHPRIQYIPDPVDSNINNLILIFLSCKKEEVLNVLKPYVSHSVYLEFMFNSNNFDYTKVIINNYMWKNFIVDKTYNEFMRQHRYEIINQSIKEKYVENKMTHQELEFLFKYLIPFEEIETWYK